MSLTVCNESHEEIVYEVSHHLRGCPLCLANEQIFDLESKINELELIIDEMDREKE